MRYTGDFMVPMKIEVEGASCALWMTDTPPFSTYKTGCIGDFQADDIHAGKALVQKALALMKDNRIEYAIGPMNGDTWHSYRLVSGTDNSPAYFMEPQNPAFYPEIFQQSGFDVIGAYSSGRVDLTTTHSDYADIEGINICPFSTQSANSELEKIYQLSLKAFAGNFLYTPIGREEFMALYTPVLPYLVPDFVLMAETDNGELQGFLFAVPDYAQGTKPDQIIVKTYASRRRGLGRTLLDLIHLKAKQAGFHYAIHALMHENNVSRQRSERYGHSFRQYSLYGRKIIP